MLRTVASAEKKRQKGCPALLCLFGLAVCFIAGMGACGGSDMSSLPPPPPPAAPSVTEADLKLDLDTSSTVAAAYIYTPVGKRDPFRSRFKEQKTLPPERKPGDILTEFELDQLKLVAVVFGIPQPRAMVIDPTGKGYVVHLGARIGKNFGKVVQVLPNKIVIAEEYRDWNLRKVTNKIEMSIARDKDKFRGGKE
jgi:type IV pilus assembly protein PilP